MSKKSKEMKGFGPIYLPDCGCPVDTALVELFTIKETVGMDGVGVSDNDRTKRDFFSIL